MTEQLGVVRQVIVPVADVERALPFFRDTLGLAVRFQDGDRWAALELGDLTLALAGPGEQPAGDAVVLGVKVADLDAALEQVRAEGGEVLDEPRQGAHERRATCRVRTGTTLTLYQPLA